MKTILAAAILFPITFLIFSYLFEDSSSSNNGKNRIEVAKKEKIGVDGGKAGGDLKVDMTKSYDDYTSKELDEMKKKYPEAYETLYRKKYPRAR